MRALVLSSAMSIVLSVLPFSLSGQASKSDKDLPERHRKWLREEVVYLIGPKERDVFLRLETDRERDIFIEAFWKQRDPTPNTPQNEFKEEHYQRIVYANRHFGRESPAPGWRSEMGRIYIILGPPKSEDKFENVSEVRPTIIWFYEGLAQSGLPNAFNVVFFKEDQIGEYKLYTPTKHGPHRLLPHFKGDVRDFEQAYAQLLEVSPQLAEVSVSLIPGEAAGLVTPSLASDVLVNSKIPAAAYEGVKDAYAQKLLMYKDRVEVEYTANYVDSESLLDVILDPSGLFFVHYLIEPKRLTLEASQGKLQAWLEVDGRVADAGGATIHQVEGRVPLDYPEEQAAKLKDKLFSYQDMFPLLPGTYKFSLILKNAVSKEFSSMERDVFIPERQTPWMSPLLLANRTQMDTRAQGRNKPFQAGGIQYVPSPRNDFIVSDTLSLFLQVSGLTPDLRRNGRLLFILQRQGVPATTLREKSLSVYPDILHIDEAFSLSGLAPAYYVITVSLVDAANKEVLAERAPFMISPVPSLPRPWVVSLSQPAPADPLYANILGNQAFRLGDTSKAHVLLEEASRKRPQSAAFARDFGRVLFQEKEYDQVKRVAAPFLSGDSRYDFLEILGRSFLALGQFAEAISHFKEHLAHFGTNIAILNAVGEGYFQLGDTKEALVAWERSLQLDPKQEDLRKRVVRIKEIK